MGFVNPLHIIFVAVVALLVLGPKRLPEVARQLGNGYREFRDQLSAATSGQPDDAAAPREPAAALPQRAADVDQA